MGRWKNFLFGWSEKWEDEKCSLYKLIIMSLLYNSGKVSVIKWGYLCKMHFSSLFPPHFSLNLGG